MFLIKTQLFFVLLSLWSKQGGGNSGGSVGGKGGSGGGKGSGGSGSSSGGSGSGGGGAVRNR